MICKYVKIYHDSPWNTCANLTETSRLACVLRDFLAWRHITENEKSYRCVGCETPILKFEYRTFEWLSYQETSSYTYLPNPYPFNTYPFKRNASTGMAMYVHAKHAAIRIHSIREFIRIHSMHIHSKGMHQQAWQCMWRQNISLHITASAGMAMSMGIIHVISYHCYSAGMAIKKKPCFSFKFLLG